MSEPVPDDRRPRSGTKIGCAVVGGALLLLFTVILFGPRTPGLSPEEQERCHEEGRAYYRAIGSYPTWSTGEFADDKIAEMCSRNPLMFHDMSL